MDQLRRTSSTSTDEAVLERLRLFWDAQLSIHGEVYWASQADMRGKHQGPAQQEKPVTATCVPPKNVHKRSQGHDQDPI
jgi:hypothetical protein